jgi:hypothetical protein
MKSPLDTKIIELYHTARIALAGNATVPDKFERMQYVKKALKEHYPDLIKGFQFDKHIWFHITDLLRQE